MWGCRPMYRLTSKSSTFAEAFQVCLRTKTQTGQLQSTLLRTGRIAKLDVTIDATELKGKRLGTTALAATSALQKKYGLQVTEELDPTTYDRLVSVVASRPMPVNQLKVKAADQLVQIQRVVRLNMTNQHVGQVQRTLAFLGYTIDLRRSSP